MKSSLSIPIQPIEPSGLSFETDEKPEVFPVIAELVNAGECRFTGPVHIEGKAERTQDLITVTGTVRIEVRLSCSRCLKDFGTSLSETFSLTFSQKVPLAEPVEKELTADEIGLIRFQGEQIDLHESIQEHIIMMLPQRPLCSESCKGLCPQCGADLNQAECGCWQPVLDDRLAILKNLKLNADDE